jgi:phosphoribosyl 1,2-cyclic phosphodiesterase
MKVTYRGVRGSVPSPGRLTLHYGGDTPCMVLEHGPSRLILDAGSGLRALGREMTREEDGDIDLLLSHVHWDHIQGLPFFAPVYSERRTVRVYGPQPDTTSLAQALELQMAPPYFPLHFAGNASRLRVTELTLEPRLIGPFEIQSVLLRHPGRTFGYRIRPSGGGPSVSYMTNNELGTSDTWADLVAFLRDTDVLVHDAMFTEVEAEARVGWGHSSIERVVDLAVAAGVKRVTLFHHDPNRSDDDLDRLLEGARERAARMQTSLTVDAAIEGRSLEL